MPWIRDQLSAFRSPLAGERRAAILVVVLCIIAFFLRIYFFAVNRSLWADEAALANNIVSRSALGLFAPLASQQAAPPAFLLLEKAIITLVGAKDWAFRLVPLWAGLISVPLMYLVAQEYVNGWAPLISLALFTFSERLVYYSSEAKQYSTDVFAALVLLFLAHRCLDMNAQRRSFTVLGVVALCAIWLSHPAVFVLGSICIVLGLTLARRRDWVRLQWLIILAGLAAANLTVVYFVSLRHAASNSALAQFWQPYFAPIPPWSDWAWYRNSLTGMLVDPGGLPGGIAAALVLLIGLVSIALSKPDQALLLLFTPGFTVLASSLRLYPFQGRLLLFLTPILLMTLAEGLDRIRTLTIRINRPLSWILAGAGAAYFLSFPVGIAYAHVLSPPKGEDIKPVLAHIEERRTTTDVVYVYYGARDAFSFYAHFYGLSAKDYIIGTAARDNPESYIQQMDSLEGHRRVWFVFSHECPNCPQKERLFFLAHLNQIGVLRHYFLAPGASAYLYDLTRKP